MHHVEPTGAEAEVPRLGVEDQLVALADLADQRLVGPRRALLVPDPDTERIRPGHDSPPQLQHV